MKKVLFVLGAALVFLSCEMNAPVSENMTAVDNVAARNVSASTSIDLGIASEYNLFILGDMNMMYTDALGMVAAAGDIRLQGYGVGLNVPEAGDAFSLVAGGSISYQNGTVYHGNVAYGNDFNASGFTILNGTATQTTPIEFTAAETELKALSLKLAGLPATGTVVNEWGKLIFTGTQEELNIFTIDSGLLESAHTLSISTPEGSTSIINVTGNASLIQSKGMQEMDSKKQNVLWNFAEATELTVRYIGFKGSILAPKAALHFYYGNIEGNIIAASLEGTGESHFYPFKTVDGDEPELPEGFSVSCIYTRLNTSWLRYKFYIYGTKLDLIESIYLNGILIDGFANQTDTYLAFYSPGNLNQGLQTIDILLTNGASYTFPDGVVIE